MRLATIFCLLSAFYCLGAALTLNGISKSQGLSESERKAILDEHNRLRTMVARGLVRGQPAAADMTRLEWSDSVAMHAQAWADKCDGEKKDNYEQYGEGQNYASSGDRRTLLKDAFQMWYTDEQPYFQYSKSPSYFAAYTQLMNSDSTKLGCGANACSDSKYARMVCNFFRGGNVYGKKPYQTGTACSKCPEGFGYCLDSLCTSEKECDRNSGCRCTVNAQICSRNGAFNSDKCQCNCQQGWTGLNCDKMCEDPPLAQCPGRARNGECEPGPSNPYYLDMIMSCPAACGKCKAACKNIRDDCRDLKEWGNCESTLEFMEIFCPKECGVCRM